MADATAMSHEVAQSGAPERKGLKATLLGRWPTLLAIAVSIPGFTDAPSPALIDSLAQAMLLLPLWYVLIDAVGRRDWTWYVLGGALVLFVLLRFQDAVEPAVVIAGISVAAAVWGVIRGRIAKPSFLLQLAGLTVFAALAFAGLAAEPEVGLYIVAAGWFAHGLWDLAHHRADAGVARTGAEWCAVVDILIAVQLVLMSILL